VSNDDQLLRAFRIGPADIEANRANRLGPGQIERLRRNVWLNVLVVLPLQVALLVFVIIGHPAIGAYVVGGGLLVLLTLAELSWAWKVRRAISDGTVRGLRGKVRVQRRLQSGTWITVGGDRNRLWASPRHVVPGAEYRVYVAPATQLVVAMEPENYD
jgi:hypothetical protein